MTERAAIPKLHRRTKQSRRWAAATALGVSALIAPERPAAQQPLDAAATAISAEQFAPDGERCGDYPLAPTVRSDRLPDLASPAGWILAHNLLRGYLGLAPLKEDPVLDRTAQKTANYLASHNLFAHPGPNSGVGTYFALAGLVSEYSREAVETVGENLGISAAWASQSSKARTFNCLTQSPTHRASMISPDFNRVGVGMADYPEDRHIDSELGSYYAAGVVVIHFAGVDRPQSGG